MRLAPGQVAVTMTRDSVCMADDVDAPHAEVFVSDGEADLFAIAAGVAAGSYLPMPSDAWRWTITAGDVVMAVRPRLLWRRALCLQGDPASVRARDVPALVALYVKPGSPRREARR